LDAVAITMSWALRSKIWGRKMSKE
jgi:hypothetical protein